MKKTQFIDAIKNIKNRLPSFLSVILVVAIGTGGFFTTQNIYRSLDDAFEGFYERQNFKDLDLVSAGGIVESDLEAVSRVTGVDAVEGVIHISGELSHQEDKYNVQIVSLTEKVSIPAVLEGKLPAGAGEVAINEDLAEESGLKINDKVTIKNTSDLSSDPLKEEEFTVTAIVRHPEYLRNAQAWAIVLPLSAFDFEATNNSYTDLYVTGDDKIEEELWKLLPTLKSQTTLRMQDQVDELIGKATEKANEQLLEAEKQIKEQEDSAMEQLDAAEKQISDFESLFVDGKEQIEEGKKKLEEAYKQLMEGESEYASGLQQLNKARKAYDQVNDVVKQIKKAIGKDISEKEILEYLEGLNQLIAALQSAIESGDDDMIMTAVNFLFDFIEENPDVQKIIDEASSLDDLIDADKLAEIVHEKKEFVKMILEQESGEAIAFLDFFTSEGLNRYLDQLHQYIDDLADALESGSEEAIGQAKEKIRAFLEEDGSVIVDDLLIQYIGLGLDEIYSKLDEDIQVLKPYADILDQIIDAVENNTDFQNLFSKESLNGIIDQMIDLTYNYSEALADENQEEINAARQALVAFLNDQQTKDAVELIKLFNEDLGVKLEDYIAVIKLGEQIIDYVDFSSLADAVKESIDVDFPEILTPDSVLPALEKAKDIIDLVLDLSESFTPENYEKLRTMLDAIIEDDTATFVLLMIKYKYGFDFYEIANRIQDGTYVETIRFLADYYIDQLKNNTAFFDEMGRTIIEAKLNEYYALLDELEEKALNNDLNGIIKGIQDIAKLLSDSDMMLLKQLVYTYFKNSLPFEISQLISAEKLQALSEKMDQLTLAVRTYIDLGKKIRDGERKLAEGREELDQGWKDYYAGLAQLQEKEKLLNSSADEIADARAQLEQKKQDALLALQEAKDRLAQARKDAEEAIAGYREEILNRQYNWVIQNRNTNASYADTRGPINGARGSSSAFGALFFIVIALVCFSTIAIIVEEEKKSVGTTKAFGFYNREILGKYLIFGLTAAVIGSILGCIIGFVVCRFVLNYFEGNNVYLVGRYKVVTSPTVMVIVSLAVAALCALATYVACSDLLKSPAALLMKGETIATRDRKNKKKELRTDRPKRSLYSRLILRNIVNEKERVMITVFIVAISCFCTGIGITLRDGFVGMLGRQKTDVYLYDFRINQAGGITEEELEQVETILTRNDADYLSANYSVHLFEKDQKVNALNVVTADKDKLNSFIAIKDPKTKKSLTLPQEGVLVQLRLSESYGVSPGTNLTLYDSQLETYQVPVVGCFQNYQGRLVLVSREAYSRIFNEEVEDNCYYVRLNQDNYDTVYRELSDIEHISIEKSDSYKQAMENAIGLFNIIIILMTLMSILMSFLILTNLANIYITRKKKELIVMRINGFSIKETIRYLAKETLLTTVLGAVVALVMGYFLGIIPIRVLEQPDAQFIRSFNVKAWIIAIILESIFSLIINSLVFRKVRKLNFREVL
ncbi:MAG: FtsX-like permease family protein [Erysipelotrichaceae bacterium]|nr:FtsX-like permease family protein [Erysipelotrichaceae bacterium]